MVGVDIADRQPARHQRLAEQAARLLRHLDHPPVAIIPKQLRRLLVLDLLLRRVDLRLDVPIGQDQILITVEIPVEKAQPKGQRPQRGLQQPRSARSIDEDLAAGLAVERECLAAEVANGDGKHAVVGNRGNIYAHARTRPAGLVVADTRGETPFLKTAST